MFNFCASPVSATFYFNFFFNQSFRLSFRSCCVVPPRWANRRSVTPALVSATLDFCLCPTSHFPRASDESGTARRSQKCNISQHLPVFFSHSLIKKRNLPGDSQRPQGAGVRSLAATHSQKGVRVSHTVDNVKTVT